MIDGNTISYERGMALIEDLHVLCHNMQANQERLVAAGFSAFKPHQDWVDGICEEHGVLEKHRMVEIETAKAILHNVNMELPVEGEAVRRIYRSTLSADDYEYMGDNIPRDPFEPIRIRMMNNDEENYQRAMDRITTHQREILKRELTYVHSDPDFHAVHERYHRYNRAHRLRFIGHYAAQKLAALGFEHAERSSTRHVPVLEKPINDNWVLRWSHFDETNFRLSRYDSELPEFRYPFFRPDFLICSRELTGDVEHIGYAWPKTNGKCLSIGCSLFTESSLKGYHTFFQFDLCALCVQAHAALLTILMPDIEKALSKHFPT